MFQVDFYLGTWYQNLYENKTIFWRKTIAFSGNQLSCKSCKLECLHFSVFVYAAPRASNADPCPSHFIGSSLLTHSTEASRTFRKGVLGYRNGRIYTRMRKISRDSHSRRRRGFVFFEFSSRTNKWAAALRGRTRCSDSRR